MPIQSPEEFLQQRLLPIKSLREIREKFRVESGVLEAYKDHISHEYRLEFDQVMQKVNFLMNACLRNDNKAVSEFLAEFGKVDNDAFVLDWEKILEQR